MSEFNALWREYVAAFGELMRQADRDAQSPAAKQMVCLCSRKWPVGLSGTKTFCSCYHGVHVSNTMWTLIELMTLTLTFNSKPNYHPSSKLNPCVAEAYPRLMCCCTTVRRGA